MRRREVVRWGESERILPRRLDRPFQDGILERRSRFLRRVASLDEQRGGGQLAQSWGRNVILGRVFWDDAQGGCVQLDFSKLHPRDAYAWMTSTILPRPIAWVSSLSAEGKNNLAPFSFFQGVTANPPTLMFVPVNTREGSPKDTLRNIEATREFVVNMVPFALAEKMNATAALLAYGESEFAAFGIESAPSVQVKPPRVADSPVVFECALHSIVRIGEGALAANVVFGSILSLHVDETVLGENRLPDAGKLDLVGRLGGEDYARTTERFGLKRPDR